eukprot:5653855-Prymnesium_polylepis.1
MRRLGGRGACAGAFTAHTADKMRLRVFVDEARIVHAVKGVALVGAVVEDHPTLELALRVLVDCTGARDFVLNAFTAGGTPPR